MTKFTVIQVLFLSALIKSFIKENFRTQISSRIAMGSVGCPLRRLPLAPSLSLELRRWRRTPAHPEATFPARLASLLPAAPSCSWHVGVKPQAPGSPVRLAPPAIPRAPRRASLPEVKLRPAKRCGPLLSAALSCQRPPHRGRLTDAGSPPQLSALK